MGVLWIVMPIDPVMESWLDEMAITYPKVPSRLPTGAEIKTAVGGLRDYDAEITDKGIGADWQAMITDKSSYDK